MGSPLLVSGLFLGRSALSRFAGRLRPGRTVDASARAGDGRPGFQEIEFRSTDGLVLEALWSPGEGSRVVVLAHGRDGDSSSPYVSKAASIYGRAGFGVLALDLRGRGGSEGRFLTGGYQEERDVHGALDWLREQGFEAGDVVLHGWSTGAVAVLRAAPGAGVAAVIEESSYADLPLLLGDFMPGPGRPADRLTRLTRLAARLRRVEFEPLALRPREDAARLYEEGVPLLVIHSLRDGVVPFGHAGIIVAAHRDAVFWEVGGCGHAAAYTRSDYEERLLDFLGPAPGAPQEPEAGGGSGGANS